jgi:3-oxoacyl-[acyl-carrier protein] reductase
LTAQPLTAQTVLVTGATGVIGRAVAAALCGPDTTLALHYRADAQAAEDLRRQLKPGAADVVTVRADLADADGAATLLDRVGEAVGAPDVLVSNAAVLRPGLAVRVRPEDWSVSVAVNLTAAMMLVRGVLGPMVDRGYGRIVLVTSVAGLRGWPYQSAYAATKAGLVGLMKTVARESARAGVTANAVAPGYVPSPMSGLGGDRAREAILAQTPMGRPGTAEEVAAAVAFLCGPLASYITGQVLAVDGGMSA